jgi:Ni,Fe-hydrogenase I cytochrome b subunit
MGLPDLISLQSAILNDYLHNVWTTFGTYVLAMGWIITSDKSRSFLLSNPAARVAAVSAAVLILFIEIGILFFLQHKSESLYHYIQTTKEWMTYAPSESDGQQIGSQASKLIVLETRHITILFPIVSSIIAAILCFSFITMIVHLKESRETG